MHTSNKSVSNWIVSVNYTRCCNKIYEQLLLMRKRKIVNISSDKIKEHNESANATSIWLWRNKALKKNWTVTFKEQCIRSTKIKFTILQHDEWLVVSFYKTVLVLYISSNVHVKFKGLLRIIDLTIYVHTLTNH